MHVSTKKTRSAAGAEAGRQPAAGKGPGRKAADATAAKPSSRAAAAARSKQRTAEIDQAFARIDNTLREIRERNGTIRALLDAIDARMG